jgi:DNA-binding transcriptional MerR regulator
MNGYRISQAAQETGLTASSLRFYEQQGIVVPDRAPNGYRRYDERSLSSLRFIARAKRLGLTLGEAAELLDDEACAPVQTRMKAMVGDRLDRTQEQVADLIAFSAELQRAAARLDRHTPVGACDDTCGCTADAADVGLPIVQLVPLAAAEHPHIACSLEPAGVPARISSWRSLLDRAHGREPI